RVETRSDLLAVLQRSPALTHFTRPFRALLTGVQVSPDDRLLAVAASTGVIRFIHLSTWTQSGADVRLGDPVAPRAISFSPDGRTLMVITVAATRSRLEAIDVATRTVRSVAIWHEPNPSPPLGSDGIAYSPDGRSVAVSLIAESTSDLTPNAGWLVMIDAGTGRTHWRRRYPMRSQQQEPHVTFARSGELLTSAQQGDTILWNTHTGRVVRRYPVGGLPAVSRDGREVALGRNSPADAPVASSWMTVLNLRSGRYRTLAASLSTAWMRGVAFTPDGSRIVGDAFDGVHVWDVASGTIGESYVGQPGQRSVMAADPRVDTAFVGSQDGSVAGFDISGRHRLGQMFVWNPPGLTCAGESAGPCDAVDPSADLLADTQNNGTVAMVNLRTLRREAVLPARDGPVADAVAFLPDGRTLVDGGSNGHVTLWDLATRRATRTLHFSAPVQLTAPSPDGRLLAVQTQSNTSTSSEVAVVALATGRVLMTRTVPDGSSGLRFTPDGRELVAAGCCEPGSTVESFSVPSGRELFRDTFSEHIEAEDVDPKTGLIGVGGEDGVVLFLDPRTGRRVGPPLRAAAGNIEYLAFSPNGRHLAVGGADNAVNLWDLRTRKRLGDPFGPYPGTVPATLFERTGQLLVIQLEQAEQWPMDERTWRRFACQVAGRDLTRAEWRDALPNRPFQAVCPEND
ncbi:MAG: WD40 repeat domain-containing protein, partial [Solirubrobacteraceae bacterium]